MTLSQQLNLNGITVNHISTSLVNKPSSIVF